MWKKAKWWLPIVIVIGLTPFYPWLDLKLAHHFYMDSGAEVPHFVNNCPVCDLFFRFGCWPGLALGIIAAIIFSLSFFIKRWALWRAPSLTIVLTLIVGAGLIVNTLFKEHWGRPRPRQLTEFAGTEQYRSYYVPHINDGSEPFHSFPSGHVSMGFFFLVLCRVGLRQKSKTLFFSGAALTLFFGLGLSFARIAQGAHFLSDALFSALFMWLTALAMEALAYSKLSTRLLDAKKGLWKKDQ